MVEGARLEIVYRATYRGFESLSLRQEKQLHDPLVVVKLLLFVEKWELNPGRHSAAKYWKSLLLPV